MTDLLNSTPSNRLYEREFARARRNAAIFFTTLALVSGGLLIFLMWR